MSKGTRRAGEGGKQGLEGGVAEAAALSGGDEHGVRNEVP